MIYPHIHYDFAYYNILTHFAFVMILFVLSHLDSLSQNEMSD